MLQGVLTEQQTFERETYLIM